MCLWSGLCVWRASKCGSAALSAEWPSSETPPWQKPLRGVDVSHCADFVTWFSWFGISSLILWVWSILLEERCSHKSSQPPSWGRSKASSAFCPPAQGGKQEVRTAWGLSKHMRSLRSELAWLCFWMCPGRAVQFQRARSRAVLQGSSGEFVVVPRVPVLMYCRWGLCSVTKQCHIICVGQKSLCW